MRHGKTNYTNTFPDLTDEGLQQVRTLGLEQVQRWMIKHSITPETLSIVSSPAPRAHGTASLICDGIGHAGRILFANEMRPLNWRDQAKCAKIIKEMSGYINLESEPRFADETLFEPLHEVHTRFGKYIRSCLEHTRNTEVPDDRILIAHYETFCGVVTSLFGISPTKETELKHVEAIELCVSRTSTAKYLVRGSFRGKAVLGALRTDGVWEPRE